MFAIAGGSGKIRKFRKMQIILSVAKIFFYLVLIFIFAKTDRFEFDFVSSEIKKIMEFAENLCPMFVEFYRWISTLVA